MKASPVKLKGELLTWSAWQFYKPNLPIVGFLEIEYTPVGAAPEVRRYLSLELGLVGEELRLVSYITDGQAEPPEKIGPVSFSGRIEPLADGTHLIIDVITNPWTLLSAHLANEEVRQRDFSRDAAESR